MAVQQKPTNTKQTAVMAVIAVRTGHGHLAIKEVAVGSDVGDDAVLAGQPYHVHDAWMQQRLAAAQGHLEDPDPLCLDHDPLKEGERSIGRLDL